MSETIIIRFDFYMSTLLNLIDGKYRSCNDDCRDYEIEISEKYFLQCKA